MQNYYWQVEVDDKPWQGMKIWNEASAIAWYNHLKSSLSRHVDYKGCKVELVKKKCS